LTNVDLSGNKLSKLRQLLCTNLRSLKVDNNQIESCELVSHSTLTEISAVKNKLKNLEGFHNLGELTNLNLASNEITSLQGIRGCNKLQNLNLQGNKIVTFEDVPYLPGLEKLNLHSNPITDLAEIGKLITFKALTDLNLLESPLAEEKGDDLKKEVLILLDGLDIKKFNEEEVSADDITEAKAEKAQRIKDAEEARLA
jgi:internalin A